MIRFLSLLFIFSLVLVIEGRGQHLNPTPTAEGSPVINRSLYADPLYAESTALADTAIAGEVYPDPTSVLYKSLIIPGWGQIVNKQAWKVPIIYGVLAGLTGYSIYLTHKYHDYRAAYYNGNATLKPDDRFPDDMRFGSTPVYLQGANLSSLRDNRNFFHNRRDFIYITIGLAYGLNAIDAFIFAHLRSFDVSEDLSMRTSIKPNLLAQSSPGFTLSVELFNKNN